MPPQHHGRISSGRHHFHRRLVRRRRMSICLGSTGSSTIRRIRGCLTLGASAGEKVRVADLVQRLCRYRRRAAVAVLRGIDDCLHQVARMAAA